MTSRLTASGLCLLALYFAYHAFAGEKGLGQWSDMQRVLADRKAELASLDAEIARLENDIARLAPGSVDPDLVEALAREKLYFVYPDEIVLTEPSGSPAF
ncbi:MAG: septum formation initiator family protein [Pseudomonadota bacterium]